jgi:serine/threonine protein kinase
LTESNIHALPIGHTFDGYRILRLLGAGGFGITYLAEETAIGRKVAIKEYLPQGFAARAADSFTVRAVSAGSQGQFAWGLDRFRKEASTLVAFEHPNIVSVYRYFEGNGTAYLVMQYVEGKALDALIAGAKTLAESEIEEVIFPILDGLEQVHAAHFLHRDIKPANIYIRKDGRPVLLDFGAARQAFGSETKSITAIVSEGYAPFEQYEAKGDQGPWTDVYAIGAVLYRCITGDRPPAAPERVSARLRGTADPMVAAREAGKGRYSRYLLEATDRALSTMQADRPRSIAELRALLKGDGRSRIASRAVTETAPPSRAAATITAGAQTAKPKSRVPLLAGGAAAIAAVAVAGYFALAPKPPPPSTAATPSTPPTRVSDATPPPTPPSTTPPSTTPPQPSAEDVAERAAERAAQEAETKADADLAALKQTIARGEFLRAKNELASLRDRVEDALRKRPAHAGLQRVSAAARGAEAELAQRIAARVKDLVEGAEREAARNYAEAQRLVAEAEGLDPAAAKAARERVDAIRRRAEDDRERKSSIELHIKLAQYHLDTARSEVAQGRYGEARRVTAQVKAQLANAMKLVAPDPEPASVKTLRRDVDAFAQELEKRIAARVAVLLREARDLIQANKLDEVAKRLEEAAELEPGSAELAAARREYEEARAKPQAPADPDAAERERTRNIVHDSVYDMRTRRGAIYFAFGSSALAPEQTMWMRGPDMMKIGLDSHATLFCGYDQLEAKEPAEGRKLAQERCDTVQRAFVRRGVAASRVRTAPSAPGKGPEFRRVSFAVQSEKPPEKPPETAKAPDTPAKPAAYQLAGRTARLSRISSERRAVMRIEMQFGAGGALSVSCSAEAADGGQAACFGQRSGGGRWTLNGSTLCVSSAVLNLPGNACYELSGSGNQLRLAGGGLLAGAMLLQ